jgi:hypothetical protein
MLARSALYQFYLLFLALTGILRLASFVDLCNSRSRATYDPVSRYHAAVRSSTPKVRAMAQQHHKGRKGQISAVASSWELMKNGFNCRRRAAPFNTLLPRLTVDIESIAGDTAKVNISLVLTTSFPFDADASPLWRFEAFFSDLKIH